MDKTVLKRKLLGQFLPRSGRIGLNVTSKPKSTTINQVRSNSDDRCTLCNKSRHKFVECEKFMSYSPQQRTDAMRRLHRCFT